MVVVRFLVCVWDHHGVDGTFLSHASVLHFRRKFHHVRQLCVSWACAPFVMLHASAACGQTGVVSLQALVGVCVCVCE